MQRVLILGASGAIGGALLAEAAARGAAVTGLSRRGDALDVTDEASVIAGLGALQAPYDTVIVATGALELDGRGPEKSLRALEPAALAAQFALNAAGPILVLKHALRLMPRDRVVRFAALSARVGSIGDNRLGGWYGYRAAKAALNQLIRTASIEIARSHPLSVIVALHPGTVASPLTEDWRGQHPAVQPRIAARQVLDVLAGLTPAETGGFFDQNGRAILW
jgi:NAD(P)-dependent dehydrogenase (short-subunit alcohol dehydrogenase family)